MTPKKHHMPKHENVKERHVFGDGDTPAGLQARVVRKSRVTDKGLCVLCAR